MAKYIQIEFFVNLAVCLLALSALTSSAPTSKGQSMTCRDAAKYMKQFGWYNGDIDGMSDDELEQEIQGPLHKLKKHYDIGDDGKFDQKTANFMNKPRCAKPDNPGEEDSASDHQGQGERRKRWTRLGDSVWTTMPVTLSFKNFDNGAVSPSVQEKLAQECGNMWASQSGVKVKVLPSGQAANILVSFEFVDGKPFGTVGLAQSPTPWSTDGSYLHMDDTETWRERMNSPGGGVPMLSVLCHEMGHNLGLGHSGDKTSVMFPSVTDAVLSSDDILGIQTLYPKRVDEPAMTPETTTTTTLARPTTRALARPTTTTLARPTTTTFASPTTRKRRIRTRTG